MEGQSQEISVFGGGCFWCIEAIFDSLKGIASAVPGYAGGTIPNPSYKQVSEGNSGYMEVVKIVFDPMIITYDDLLAVFFNTHDPTTLNRQGNDIGMQYNSTIFYSNNEQKEKAEQLIKELNDSRAYEKPVITQVIKLDKFYEAEDYHQKYYENHKNDSYCHIVIAPKLAKLTKKFSELLKNNA